MDNFLGGCKRPCQPFLGVIPNLNRILLSDATKQVTATFAFVCKTQPSEEFQDVVKLQTEFMESLMKSFNEQARVLGGLIDLKREHLIDRVCTQEILPPEK